MKGRHKRAQEDYMYFSTTEVNESCIAQPKPCTLERESTFYGKTQRESRPPSEKLKISVISTGNGVNSLCEQPPTKDAVAQPGSTENIQLPERTKEHGLSQPGGKDDTQGAEEKKAVEVVTELEPLKGNAEIEPIGTEAMCQPLRTAGQSESPGAVEGTENIQCAAEMRPLETAEKSPPLEAARELQAQDEVAQDEESLIPETVPKETESPEILEQSNQLVENSEEQQLGKEEQSQFLAAAKGNESAEVLERSQLVEGAEEQQLQETMGKDMQSQLLETIPKENSPEILQGRHFMESAVKNDLLHKTSEVPGNMEEIQPEGVVGSMESPVGISETETTVDVAREIHTNEEDQHIEGETGEKVETEMENKKLSEGTETKEEETGEYMDLSAAT
ncbi:glutamate-rich protein 5 isoform X1 [Talpa occidentalis]|uniref:glutamate-rich protein 5 isoform X1 n=1 Tax=Talpa occidentalis TaxID=50954 RepID=UPI0023F7F76A|nr:glutamate-rich protein 5 isoform X1 [Talpa occidentalis]XP_054548065.1 glutamate-rich protein 5 isoform X1 [Talpa occidentalis]